MIAEALERSGVEAAALVYGMARLGAKKGLATLCIGGGMGIALCVEGV